jgi:hypothetical protein
MDPTKNNTGKQKRLDRQNSWTSFPGCLGFLSCSWIFCIIGNWDIKYHILQLKTEQNTEIKIHTNVFSTLGPLTN